MILPQFHFHRIYDIPIQFLVRKKIRMVLVDVDNTLTEDNSSTVLKPVHEWIEKMREANIHIVILSNNTQKRVETFAQSIGLDYIAKAHKPLIGKTKRELERLNYDVSEVALVGDQLFTDILCGNSLGCVSILVDPYEIENYGVYRIKRKLEIPFLKWIQKKEKRV